ncbi:hypothetical protein ACQ4M4_15610 [Leptolyngbya sp. AN02str]|uniref:hypothetical protein n=1 Tax=Leptolyngbya sp. AN02str TaxID=3423363 RepID=UPI003D310C03
MKCGWSDRPRQGQASAPPAPKPERNLSPDEIQKILAQAQAVAMNNMKPKRKQDPAIADKVDLPGLTDE